MVNKEAKTQEVETQEGDFETEDVGAAEETPEPRDGESPVISDNDPTTTEEDSPAQSTEEEPPPQATVVAVPSAPIVMGSQSVTATGSKRYPTRERNRPDYYGH